MRYTFALLTALVAVSHCLAAPARAELHAREESTTWPEELGPNSPPKEPDVDQAYKVIAQGDDKEYKYLTGKEASGWWSAVTEITKLHPDGNWLKSMFGKPQKKEDYVEVDVAVYDKGGQPVKYHVSSKDLPDGLEAGWPLLLEQAAFASVQEGEFDASQETLPHLLPERALQILTGYKAAKTEPNSPEALHDALRNSDWNPTIVQGEDNGWRAVWRIYDDGFEYVSHENSTGVGVEPTWLPFEQIGGRWPAVWKLDEDGDKPFKGFLGAPAVTTVSTGPAGPDRTSIIDEYASGAPTGPTTQPAESSASGVEVSGGVSQGTPADTPSSATDPKPTGGEGTADESTEDEGGEGTGNEGTGNEGTEDEGTGDENTGNDISGGESTGDRSTGAESAGDESTGE